MKIVAVLVAICCIVSTSTGAKITDDIATNDFDRNLRSAVSHFLRGGRAAPGTSHYLRGRRANGLVLVDSVDGSIEDGIEAEDEDDSIYQRGLRNSISHFLRGRRSNPVNHFLRGKKAAPSGFNHFLRGGRGGVNHFLRGRKAGVVNHFLRGRKSSVNHFLRGKKSTLDDELTDSGMAFEEEPSELREIDALY
jgi:hypothetical protein